MWREKFVRVSAPEVEHGLFRPLRYVENRDSAQRVAGAFREGRVVLLEHELESKPWRMQMFSAMTDATSFLVAARYYMKLDPQTKKEFFRPNACGLEPEKMELPGKECVHLSKAMVETQDECAAKAAFRGFDRLARGILLALQAADPAFQPDVYGDEFGNFTAGAGVYRDKLKPLLDSKDAGHLLSIFSYSGEGACIEHVDRGFITLVTNTDGALQVQDSQGKWLDVPPTNGLVAFAGKTLEFLTQGKFPAVPHRLASGRATGRVSLAFKLRAPLAAELVLQHGDVTTVKSGRVTVFPPEHGEMQILDYVLYWAKEEFSTWSDEINLRRIDSGLDSLEEVTGPPKAETEGNDWYRPERPLGRIWRCKDVEDPFKQCSQRGVPLQVSIPKGIQVPEDATHLAVATENEVGENPRLIAVNLNGEEGEKGDGFSYRVFLGIMKGFDAKCGLGEEMPELEKKVWEEIVALMVLRTNSGMKEALTKLAEWLETPTLKIFEACSEVDEAKQRFSGAMQRLKTGKIDYIPGEALSLDGISVFSHVNAAIQIFRNTHKSFANFGTEIGVLLRSLAPEELTSESSEVENVLSSSRPSGLKLRGAGAE